jgi:hypothetical protein
MIGETGLVKPVEKGSGFGALPLKKVIFGGKLLLKNMALKWGVVRLRSLRFTGLLTLGNQLCCLRMFFRKVSPSPLVMGLESDFGRRYGVMTLPSQVYPDLNLRIFGTFTFQHILREGNGPADSLAKVGSETQVKICHDHFDSLPRQTKGLVFLDKVGLGSIRTVAYPSRS